MGKTAPRYCPSCGKCAEWRLVDVEKKGFSMGKAVVGTLLFGEAGGLIAGSTGKKRYTYRCGLCGFMCDYDKQAI